MTNDSMLSQEEIDALLNVSPHDDVPEENNEEKGPYLSTMEEDTLGEIGNISFGSSATTLSTLLKQKVEITTPSVSIIKKKELETFTFQPVSIYVNYIEGFSGRNVLVIKAIDAAVIADIMLGGDGRNPEEELNDIHISAVQEAMNQMMGSAATSMSTIFNKKVDISPPTIKMTESEEDADININNDEAFVQVSFQLKVGNLIDSNIMQIMPITFAKDLVYQLLHETPEDEKASAEAAVTLDKAITFTAADQEKNTKETSSQFLGNLVDQQHAKVQEADFSSFDETALNHPEQRNLDLLLDIPLRVTVELGRTQRTIKDILDLSAGSIIELDKLAGEPVDILVNQKLIAKGEVVVIDENFGVRVTDIVSQSDRLKKLK
ncbi:flagellar motor switch phosphatase FliY [Virgibacillus sp. YIM 98842]|uniref:flagellar motor switch phosphatase FliY n=1 Tax=Virgibacillus sp. YIM 98842 TaxID=2663533 RepID=UPI0013DBCDEC|nr:flagellar motor switch phosphatase FliY [Virgibacillus sp. YIM 98842]